MNIDVEGLQEQLADVDLDLQDLEHDPTLAACCLKDIKQTRKSEVLREHLSKYDLSTGQVSRHAILLAPAVEAGHSDAGDNPSSSLTEDQQLADIRMQRIQQIKQAATRQQQQKAQGFGQLNQVTERDVLAKLEERQGYCVCHMAVSGYQACDELDQQLEGLAHHWQGTLFLRCVTTRRSHLRSALGLHALPALVCTRNGAIVGRTHLDMFGPVGEVLEEQVVGYLQRLRVLRAAGGQRAGDDDGSGVESEESEGGEAGGQAPCEVCGRRYPHEHVKAVYARDESGSDAEDTDDDV